MLDKLIPLILATVLWMPAAAADWPTKPVRLIVPFPAGGATDGPARLLGERLSSMWGQPVVVENRPGAGGALGAAEVARSAPDGYTLLFPSGSVMTANQYVYVKLSYDPERDFVPVTKLVAGPQVLVVAAASPYKTAQELIAATKAGPKKLTFGHAGVGSQSHLATEYLMSAAGFDAIHVPYKGDPPAVTDIIAGVVDFGVINMAAAVSHIESGRLRALGVTSAAPIPQLPGVPALASIVPGFENSGWFGIVAPRGVPAKVIQRVYRDARTAIEEPEVRARLVAMGFTPVGNSPDEMSADMTSERQRWARVVSERKIKVAP